MGTFLTQAIMKERIHPPATGYKKSMWVIKDLCDFFKVRNSYNVTSISDFPIHLCHVYTYMEPDFTYKY